MQDQENGGVPDAPETQPADVREDLHQENISKVGDARTASDAGAEQDSHMGAVEDTGTGHSDQQVVTPPMSHSPYNITRGENLQDMDVDPQDEITGGG
jgi:hypothetical protein